VPEWTPDGETYDATKHGVYVSSMSVAERNQWEALTFRNKTEDEETNLKNYRSYLLIHTCETEDGSRLFDVSDRDWLNAKSSVAVDRLYAAASRVNKLGKSDHDDLVKN
jgi:hypothetical protein